MTEICFYNKLGEIEISKVNNIRKILQETLTEESLEDWWIGVIFDPNIRDFDISPISILGDVLNMEDIYNGKREKIAINISCETNIWFPWVPDNAGAPYDNRDLAHYHTAHLNSFLSDIKQLVMDFRGTFEVECKGDVYNKQIDENGFFLNI